jgi:Glycosyl transferase family 11
MRPERVVSVELMGGLGNQMFQYAAGHALARRVGVPLRLDVSQFARSENRRYLLDCFGVPGAILQQSSPRSDRGRIHALAGRACNRLGLPTRLLYGGWNVYDQPGVHFDPAFESLAAPVHLRGYFQSELFFRAVAEEIRGLLSIRVPASAAFEAAGRRILAAECPVSIHVRRGDYLRDEATLALHGICGESYYRAATALAQQICRKATYFVFSDDPASARELLAHLDHAQFVSGDIERPWEDLALMASCRGHIIANSSFSWWGAWLDPHPDKWVIAPRQWYAPAHQRTVSTADLFCPGWITL